MRHFILPLLIAAAPATAADFSISGGPPPSGGGLGTCTSYFASGTAPLAAAGNCSGSGLGNGSGNSRADFANLGARAAAAQFNAGFTVPSIWESGAAFQDSITFTATDPFATHVAVSMDLGLDGNIVDFGPGGSALDLTAEVRLGSPSNHSLAALSPNGSTPVRLEGFTLVDGSLNAYGLSDAIVRTPVYMLPVNQPLFFSLRLVSRVGALGSNGLVDFGSTFAAANPTRVFNLAPGVTADAGTWLVGNQLAPGVPEPAGWALLITGFGLVGAMQRRQARVSNARASA
jgi:hypothetical protein